MFSLTIDDQITVTNMYDMIYSSFDSYGCKLGIFYIFLIFGVNIFRLDKPCLLQGASLVHPPERPFMMIWLEMINSRVISWRETLTQVRGSRQQSEIKSQISMNFNHLEPVAAFLCLGCTVAHNNRYWVDLY